MTFLEHLKRDLQSSVDSELGNWINDTSHPELGAGIFAWKGSPKISLYELGFVYHDGASVSVAYDDVVEYEGLTLRSVMSAAKTPKLPLNLFISTPTRTFALRMPFTHYSTFMGILSRVDREKLRRSKTEL